jgi:hypothetical protein
LEVTPPGRADRETGSIKESLSFHEFVGVPLESLLALQTAEIVRFSIVCDLELGRILVKNYAANRIPGHYLHITFYSHKPTCVPAYYCCGIPELFPKEFSAEEESKVWRVLH